MSDLKRKLDELDARDAKKAKMDQGIDLSMLIEALKSIHGPLEDIQHVIEEKSQFIVCNSMEEKKNGWFYFNSNVTGFKETFAIHSSLIGSWQSKNDMENIFYPFQVIVHEKNSPRSYTLAFKDGDLPSSFMASLKQLSPSNE